MVDYKRIKLKITDLSLESSFRIFSFLKELLEKHRLKLSELEENLVQFSTGEKYFIVHYAKQYFDTYNPKSYLSNWFTSEESNRSDHSGFTLEKIELKTQSEKLVSYCRSIEPKLK